MRAVFLEGKSIFLCPLSKEDASFDYASWINDQETTLFMGSGKFPMSTDSIRNYIESYTNGKGILLGVFLKKSSRHIGNITLHQIDWTNRNAEIGILIGDKKSRGKGYASEAIGLLAAHSFDKLNLHKLCAGVVEGNKASKRAFEKAGFKTEGILRKHFFLNGEYLDVYRMGLLKSEFNHNRQIQQ